MYVQAYKSEEVSGEIVLTIETYTEITNLSFAPSADLVGASVPINEFEVDIHTTDNIDIGAYAELYDDNDNLWASYWVIYAEHIDQHTLRMRAQSNIALLDRVTLPAVYYNGESITTVLDNTIVKNSGAVGVLVPMAYTLDSSFSSVTITGFCPEQTARERLLWVCFVIGAYVKSFFNTQIEIIPIDTTQTMIPIGDTYWKPTITFNDWVTAIKCKAYSFTAGTPQTTDTYVKDANGTYYIVTETDLTLTNPDAPSAAPENIMTIEGVYLVNSTNVSGILTHLSQWYFTRMEVALDVIDNAAYIPGDKVVVYTDARTMKSGFINSATFTFGLQSKAAIHLTASADVETGNLIIIYKYSTTELERATYFFPVGYAYTITNPYIDQMRNNHRYIYRPLNENATGTIAAGDNTNTQNCDIALDLYEGVLHVISVDEVIETTDEITIGVIA